MINRRLSGRARPGGVEFHTRRALDDGGEGGCGEFGTRMIWCWRGLKSLFLKQYEEWVEANENRLEDESYKVTHFLMCCAFLPFHLLTLRGITFLIFMNYT